jgi:hypothetical protein
MVEFSKYWTINGNIVLNLILNYRIISTEQKNELIQYPVSPNIESIDATRLF